MFHPGNLILLVKLFGALLAILGFSHQHPLSNDDLKCGITFFNDTEFGHHRINHGDPASEGQWPWMATLVFRDGHKPRGVHSIIWCSATIISEEYILSAGHCMKDFEEYYHLNFIETFQIAVGVLNPVTDPQRVDIAAAFPHPNCTLIGSKNDLLLLKLAKPLVLSNNVQPICLAAKFDGDDVTKPEDESAIVAGWGYHQGTQTNALLYGHMYFVDIETCAKNHPTAEISKNMHICAAGKVQSTETRDIGGPIFIKSELKDSETGRNRFVEVGICSFGNNYPDVFTRVSPYCEFIKKTTNGSVNCVNL